MHAAEKAVIAVVALLLVAWYFTSQSDVTHGPGVIAPNEPVETQPADSAPFQWKGKYTITPLADIEVEARVLSRMTYSSGREGDLSPMDLALGWGAMSDESVLEKIRIWQSNRCYFWRVREFPIPKEEIASHSANMHLIPADAEIARELKNVRKGHVVRFRGRLVRIEAPDGWRWKSSLSRTDDGVGACELVWVEAFEIVAPDQ